MATYDPRTEEFSFVAYWDSDERGPLAVVEVTASPEWWSNETVQLVERDLAAAMYKAKQEGKNYD